MSRPESRQSRRGGGSVTATSECERPQLRRSYCALADKGLGRRGTLCRSLARGEAIPSSAEIQEFICKLKRERQSIGLDLYPTQQEKAPVTKRQRPSETEASTDTQSHLDAAEPTAKKPRMSWSHELHQKFVEVVAYLGVDSAVPKAILDLMNVDGLTRENVASHLQKHRIQLRKKEHEHAVYQAQAAVPACLDFAKWFAGLQSAVETHNARLTLPYTYHQPPPPTPEMMARAGVRIPDPPIPPELHIDPPPAATCVGSV